MFNVSSLLTKRIDIKPVAFTFPALPVGTNASSPPATVAQVMTMRQKLPQVFTEMNR